MLLTWFTQRQRKLCARICPVGIAVTTIPSPSSAKPMSCYKLDVSDAGELTAKVTMVKSSTPWGLATSRRKSWP